MPRVLLIVIPVVIAFWIFTVVDCAIQPSTRHRGVRKPVWILITVLLPVLGGILWLAVGRTRRGVMARRAPDDDPEFLDQLGARSDQDERIRRLEEELALLDSEDEDPRSVTPAPRAEAAGETPTVPPAPRAEDDDDARGQRGAIG